MSFSGRVDRESHLGGLLISFEGRPPRLGARMRISGGRILGKVETVLGPVESPLIHVHPLYDGIDPRASVGSPVEIAPRDNSRKGRPRRNSRGGFRGRKGARGDSRGKGGHGFRDNKGTKRKSEERGGRGGRGGNHQRRGAKGGNRGSGRTGRRTHNSGRRRDSGKGGRGKRR